MSKAKPQHCLDMLAKVLKCTFKEQNPARNPAFEAVLKEKDELNENLSLMSLNINGIRGKEEELSLVLGKHRPDLLCLQETHRM